MALPPQHQFSVRPASVSSSEDSEVKDRALALLLDAARAPLSDWPSRYTGYRAMGYLCSYVPEEMIHAAGYVPVRVRSTDGPLQEADAHLQSFSCALCRSGLEQALGRDLGFLAGVVFAHTCDAMQALADLWRMGTPGSPFVYTVMQPANLGTPAVRPYLLAELHRFQARLTELNNHRGGVSPPGDEELRGSIALYDETRRLVAALHSLRGRVSTSEFFATLDAAQVMPREMFNPLLSQLLSSLEMAQVSPSGPRLFLSGAVLDERRLLELIEDLGASVAGDDLCTGSRHFHGRIAPVGWQHRYAPLEALADYYLERPPCPTKYHPAHDPGKHLLDQVDSARADGVVFTLEKFCEPHAFDYARVLPSLDAAGVPHLLLEMEQTPSLEGLRTRLQAFLETI